MSFRWRRVGLGAALFLVPLALWRLKEMRPLRPVRRIFTQNQVVSMIAGANGRLILGCFRGNNGGRVEVRDVDSGRVLSGRDYPAPVKAIALSDDGRFLAVASGSVPAGDNPLIEGTVEIWERGLNSPFGRLRRVLKRNKLNWHFDASCLAWEKARSGLPRLAVGGEFYQFKRNRTYPGDDWWTYKGDAALWNIHSTRPLRECGEAVWGGSGVNWLAFDAKNRVWSGATWGDLETGIFGGQSPHSRFLKPSGQDDEIDGLLTTSGGVVIAGGRNRNTDSRGFWARASSRGSGALQTNWEDEDLNALALSGDGQLLAVNSEHGVGRDAWDQIVIFDFQTATKKHVLSGGGTPLWTPNGRFLVVAEPYELSLSVYDAQQCK